MQPRKKHAHAYYDLSGIANALPNTSAREPQSYVNSGIGSSVSGSTTTVAPIDSEIPSLVQDRELAQEALFNEPVYGTFQHAFPPPACMQYGVQDQGISGPQYCRMTMYNAPVSESLRASTGLPLAMIVTPFDNELDLSINSSDGTSSSSDNKRAVPVTQFDGGEIPRCARCRTYINPAMLFSDGGMRFVCNMCQFSNRVPEAYFQPIDATNRRIDWQSRPELAFGSYDILAPPEYNTVPGAALQPLHYLYLIDVTSDAMKKDLPQLAGMAIRSALYGYGSSDNDDEEDNGDGSPASHVPGIAHTGIKVAIATFDRSIHFYNLDPRLDKAQMLVVTDLEDAFAPIETGLFVDPLESQGLIEGLLNSLEGMFADTTVAEPAFGAALLAAQSALKPHGGGHVSVVLSSLPVWGPGHLIYKSPSDVTFHSSSAFYTNLGVSMAHSGIGVDLLLCANSYCDAPNCIEVPRLTGGNVFSYRNFEPQRDGRRFIADLCYSARSVWGYDIKIKARCSTGLQVSKYLGNLCMSGIHASGDASISDGSPSFNDPVLGSIGCNSSFAVHFHYDGKLNTKLDCHYQIAVLYTSRSGQRHIRIINFLTAVSEQYRPVLNYVDIDACVGVFARECVSQLRSGSKETKDVKASIDNRVTEIFSMYRTANGSSNVPPSVLLMPVSLRSLLIYVLSLKKSRLLTSAAISMDSRVIFGHHISSMTPDSLALILYPRIVALHNLQASDCMYNSQGFFILPKNLPAATSSIESAGVYLLFNGLKLILYVREDVNETLLYDLFKVRTRSMLNPYMNELPELDTEISRQSRALVTYYTKLMKRTFLGIQLARQGLDGAEHDFMDYMVESRGIDQPKYVDYVTGVHRKVKVLLEEKSAKKGIV